MKRNFENRKLQFASRTIILSCLIVLGATICLKNSISFALTEAGLFSAAEGPGNETKEYFRLVESRIIEAELLDDQVLEDISPALIAPQPVIISEAEYHRNMLSEYNQAVCFKRCHSPNDFSAADYTYEQWCLLIDKDGHSVFSEIPWENPDKKKKIFKYLVTNAKNTIPEHEGIGKWH